MLGLEGLDAGSLGGAMLSGPYGAGKSRVGLQRLSFLAVHTCGGILACVSVQAHSHIAAVQPHAEKQGVGIHADACRPRLWRQATNNAMVGSIACSMFARSVRAASMAVTSL